VKTAELVGGSRDGTVIVLEGWESPETSWQWVRNDAGPEVEANTIQAERYVLTGKTTTAGHAEALFMGEESVPWVGRCEDED